MSSELSGQGGTIGATTPPKSMPRRRRALALAGLSGVFMNIPEVGGYLSKIFDAGGTFVAGAAMTIISRNVWIRFKP